MWVLSKKQTLRALYLLCDLKPKDSSDLGNQPRSSPDPSESQLVSGMGKGGISSIANIVTIWGWGRDATSLSQAVIAWPTSQTRIWGLTVLLCPLLGGCV